MTSLPYTHLLFRGRRMIAVVGSHFLVLNLSGDIESSFSENEKIELCKAGPVRCVDVDLDGRYVVTAAEDKMLKVWSIEDGEGGLRLMNQRELPKKPTKIKFTKDGQSILVSDKFGDLFSYPIHYLPDPPESAEQKAKKDAFASHENPSNGTLILGHASPLNFFVLTDDEKYVVTADRDEHVRVSRYPKGYIIEMYCLGHLKFVSALHFPCSEPGALISGGGDAELKVWDWRVGKVKWEVRIWDVVERFLAVNAIIRRRGFEEEGEEGERQGGNSGGKKRRRKTKKKKAEENVEETSPVEESSETSKVLVVQNIKSIFSSSGVYILFSAVGATALFGFPYRADVESAEIIHFEFEKPVLGFSVVSDQNRTEGVVVVSLDGGWRDGGEEGKEMKETKMVRVLKITSEQFVEDFEFRRPLIESLNSKALISATPSDLKSLDLYGALSSLPKRSSDVDVDVDEPASHTVPIGAPELSASIYKAKARKKGKGKLKEIEDGEMGKKEVGRLKGKMKVLDRVKEQEQGKPERESRTKDLVRRRDEENHDSKEAKRLRMDEDVSDKCPKHMDTGTELDTDLPQGFVTP